MVNKVEVTNDNSLVVIQMGEKEDELKFVSELRDNLDDFTLISIDSGRRSTVFSAKCIKFYLDNTRSDTEGQYTYTVSFGSKVLIRNKRIVLVDCSSLLSHKVLTIK